MGKALLPLPAGKAAASYVRHLSRQADAACRRLADSADAEALHDFRVAIRRSRSWVSAYRPYLMLDRPLRRRLRELARRTNAARDAEVTLAGLQALASAPDASRRAGLRWMRARLERERQQAYADILHHIPATWPALGRDLRRRLRQGDPPVLPTFSHAAFELAAGAHAELARRLVAIAGAGDIEALHRARIAAKRLRYLLEPFRDEVTGIRAAVQRLTALQDALGALHDGDVLQGRLEEGIVQAACLQARRRIERIRKDPGAPGTARLGQGEQAGLLALLASGLSRQRQRFETLEAEYLGGRLRPFLGSLELPISRLAG